MYWSFSPAPRATPPGPDVSPSDAAEEPAAKHVLDLSVEQMDLSVSDDDAASSGDVSVADTVIYDYSDAWILMLGVQLWVD